MAELQKQVIIPTLGLFQNRAKHRIPLVHQSGNIWKCGWSYCRNVSLSRKEECVKKSLGTAKFSASASGTDDSVRGIGILNKYARPQNYEATVRVTGAADTDDGYKTEDTPDALVTSTGPRVGVTGGVEYRPGLRFDPVPVVNAAVIVSAYIKLCFTSKAGTSTSPIINWQIYGVDADDEGTFVDVADYDTKWAAKTTANVTWSFDPTDFGEKSWHISPDLKDIVQELVDRVGWATGQAMVFVSDNTGTDPTLNCTFRDYDEAAYRPELHIITAADVASSPTYFFYVRGASAGELWKLDSDKTPGEVTQGGESYAFTYQSQIAKFVQYGNDLLVTDDGTNDACQQWDVSDGPSAFEDVVASKNGRYPNVFKSRFWLWFTLISGTVSKIKGLYSAVNDQTSIDTTNDFLLIDGNGAVTSAINLTQDDQIVFCEGSAHRIVDQQTPASDFQPFVISDKDGSLGANVVSDGARLYGLNEKGIFQWPTQGYPNGFRYISPPIQTEVDKITLDKMNLVWFAYDPVNNCLHMHYPDSGYSRNTLDAVFNITQDTWENISDIWESNVMVDCFDTDGSPIMLFGQEDGYLKYISGTDDETANFTGRVDTVAIFQQDQKGGLLSRKLINIEPNTNYDGSMTLNFYVKGYNRPDEESTATWQGPYTHDSTIVGNKEFIPVNHALEYQFHMIRWDGTLKAEEWEVYELGLNFAPGSRNP